MKVASSSDRLATEPVARPFTPVGRFVERQISNRQNPVASQDRIDYFFDRLKGKPGNRRRLLAQHRAEQVTQGLAANRAAGGGLLADIALMSLLAGGGWQLAHSDRHKLRRISERQEKKEKRSFINRRRPELHDPGFLQQAADFAIDPSHRLPKNVLEMLPGGMMIPGITLATALPGWAAMHGTDRLTDQIRTAVLERRKKKAKEEFEEALRTAHTKRSGFAAELDRMAREAVGQTKEASDQTPPGEQGTGLLGYGKGAYAAYLATVPPLIYALFRNRAISHDPRRAELDALKAAVKRRQLSAPARIELIPTTSDQAFEDRDEAEELAPGTKARIPAFIGRRQAADEYDEGLDLTKLSAVLQPDGTYAYGRPGQAAGTPAAPAPAAPANPTPPTPPPARTPHVPVQFESPWRAANRGFGQGALAGAARHADRSSFGLTSWVGRNFKPYGYLDTSRYTDPSLAETALERNLGHTGNAALLAAAGLAAAPGALLAGVGLPGLKSAPVGRGFLSAVRGGLRVPPPIPAAAGGAAPPPLPTTPPPLPTTPPPIPPTGGQAAPWLFRAAPWARRAGAKAVNTARAGATRVADTGRAGMNWVGRKVGLRGAQPAAGNAATGATGTSWTSPTLGYGPAPWTNVSPAANPGAVRHLANADRLQRAARTASAYGLGSVALTGGIRGVNRAADAVQGVRTTAQNAQRMNDFYAQHADQINTLSQIANSRFGTGLLSILQFLAQLFGLSPQAQTQQGGPAGRSVFSGTNQ